LIRVIELESGWLGRGIEEKIEKTLREKNITRENLIDIKYTREGVCSYALIIYEDEE
jgi:hypothetical protein